MVRTIGRGPEQRQLKAAIERTESQSGSVVVIEGEPGIGKTRLCTDLRAAAVTRGWIVFACDSAELDRDRPFVAVGSALEDLQAQLGADLPSELVDALAILRAVTPSDESQGDRIARLITQGLHELSRSAPLLVLFEDAHWIDEASAQVLWDVARGRRSLSVLTVATFRPTTREVVLSLRSGLDSQGASNLVLSALNKVETLELAADLLGESPSSEVQRLLDDAEGNPLFITELLRGYQAGGIPSPEASSGPVPAALRSLIVRRLNAMDEPTQSLLFDASLLGYEFDFRMLAAIHSLDAPTCLARLASAFEHRILVTRKNALGFRHAVVQNIVSETRPDAVRRVRHRELGELLSEQGMPAAIVGEHHWKSSPFHRDDASEWMRKASEEVRPLSLEAALSWLERSQACLGKDAASFDVQMDIARLLVLLGRLSEAEAICASVAPRSTADEVRLRFTLTALTTVAGRTRQEEAMTHVDWLLEHFGERDPQRVEMLGWKSLLLVYRGDLDGAEKLAQLGLAMEVDENPSWAVSRPFETLGLVALWRGDVDQALYFTARATADFRHHTNALTSIMTPHFARAMALLSSRPIREVIDVIEQGYQSCDRAGHSLARLHLDPIMAIAHFASGDVATATALSASVLHRSDTWRTGGNSLPTVTGLAGYLALLRGETALARSLASSTWDELLSGGAQAGSADFAVFCIAKIAEASGETDRARELLVGVWELFAKDASLFTVAPDLVRLTREVDPALAADVVVRAEQRAARSGASLDLANALASRGHWERDPALLELSAQASEAIGWNMSALLTRHAAVTHYSDPMERSVLAAKVEHCIAQWELFELTQPIADLKSLHPRISRSRRQRPTHGPGSLSQSERTVAQLVSEGLTNKEIAQRLFVSHRTVDTHVSHSLAKLGLSSRVQLAGFVVKGHELTSR